MTTSDERTCGGAWLPGYGQDWHARCPYCDAIVMAPGVGGVEAMELATAHCSRVTMRTQLDLIIEWIDGRDATFKGKVK